MSTTLHIGALSITENGRFNLETRVHLNELGFPDTKETTIEIEGDVVQAGTLNGSTIGSDPAGVYTAIESIRALLGTPQSPAEFYVDVDGTTFMDFPPNTCINSPLITNFRTITDTGAGDQHWKYGLTVYIKQFARNDSVLEFTTSINTTYIITTQDGQRPVRKHWQASCKASNVALAYARIIALKPSAPVMTATYGRYFQEGRATGDWLWEYNQDQKITENIVVTGRGSSYVESTQVGASGEEVPPLIHRAPKQAVKIILTGEISSTDIDKVIQPDLHWTESDELFHDVGNEQGSERVIFDDMKNIYKLKYEERWIGRSYTKPDHHDHSLIPAIPEPGDGPIADVQR